MWQTNSENVVSAQPAHQRNKSMGNGKTMATVGTLNAPPKRSAFMDVSNVSNIARPVADSKAKATVKSQVKTLVSAINSREVRPTDKENKATALASKPSNAPTKSILASIATAPSNKPALRSVASSIHPAGTYHDRASVKPGPKKTTFVYKQEVAAATGHAEVVEAALVDKSVKNPRHSKSQPQLPKLGSEQPVLRRTQSRFMSKVVDVEAEADVPDDATDAAYEDAVEQFSQDSAGLAHDKFAHARASHATAAHDADAAIRSYDYSVPAQMAGRSDPKSLPGSIGAPEPEEYWDEDEEPEYDGEGYTTAHSYKSHGDNTTVGATTLVAPKITSLVEKELEMAREIVQESLTEEEIEDEAWDISMVAEYADDIVEYMRDLEKTMSPNPYYMDIQTEIQWSMRSVLMDWLVQVHHRFGLLPETLFLTVNYIDRFLSVKVVSLNKLQLVGATAIFVAAKYEEINCPSVQEIIYMVDSGYTMDEILKAERFMLSMLQFELGWPGPMSFLRRISKADDYDLETRTIAKYFLEVTIMDERFVGTPPSYLAAGAHCLARLMLQKGDWTPAHTYYSGYTTTQIKPLVAMIFDCCQDGRKHHGAIFEKYSSSKFQKSSTFVEAEINAGFKLNMSAGFTPAPNGLLSAVAECQDDESYATDSYATDSNKACRSMGTPATSSTN
ncbi:cyclin-like protein [Podospora conica]|nr:cyclin-like protein [Schizothecium conicum]